MARIDAGRHFSAWVSLTDADAALHGVRRRLDEADTWEELTHLMDCADAARKASAELWDSLMRMRASLAGQGEVDGFDERAVR